MKIVLIITGGLLVCVLQKRQVNSPHTLYGPRTRPVFAVPLPAPEAPTHPDPNATRVRCCLRLCLRFLLKPRRAPRLGRRTACEVAIQKGTRVLISLWDSLMFGRVPEYPPEH